MIISEQEKTINGGGDVIKIMSAVLNSEHETDRDREHFWTIGLNNKNIIQFIELVSLGSLTAAVVHPREVFRFAVMKGVAAIVLCHNHPSGDPSPSIEDINLTKRLAEAGEILGIGVLDHIVLGKLGDSFSFHEQGLFDPKFREMLFCGGGVNWQHHHETISAPLRKRRSPKKDRGSEAIAATVLQS